MGLGVGQSMKMSGYPVLVVIDVKLCRRDGLIQQGQRSISRFSKEMKSEQGSQEPVEGATG